MIKTFADVHGQFCKFINRKRKTDGKLNAPMQLKTFYRYMNAHYPQVALKKVMEDCCDTCIRIILIYNIVLIILSLYIYILIILIYL